MFVFKKIAVYAIAAALATPLAHGMHAPLTPTPDHVRLKIISLVIDILLINELSPKASAVAQDNFSARSQKLRAEMDTLKKNYSISNTEMDAIGDVAVETFACWTSMPVTLLPAATPGPSLAPHLLKLRDLMRDILITQQLATTMSETDGASLHAKITGCQREIDEIKQTHAVSEIDMISMQNYTKVQFFRFMLTPTPEKVDDGSAGAVLAPQRDADDSATVSEN